MQVTLTLMPGSEPWVRVQHPKGWFKVPAFVPLAEVLTGALEGWSATTKRRVSLAGGTVRISAVELAALQLRATARC